MGQQESRGGPPALVRRAAEQHNHDTTESPDLAARNRRMEKLLMRARALGRKREHSNSDSRRDSERSDLEVFSTSQVRLWGTKNIGYILHFKSLRHTPDGKLYAYYLSHTMSFFSS